MYIDKTKRNWKQTEKDVPANHYEYNTGALKITVVNNHIYHPNMWVMHCHELNISCKELGGITNDINTILSKATIVVKDKLAAMSNSITI